MRRAFMPSAMPMVSTSLVLARPGAPISSPWPRRENGDQRRSDHLFWPKMTAPMAALAARACAGASFPRRATTTVLEFFEPFDRHDSLCIMFLLGYRSGRPLLPRIMQTSRHDCSADAHDSHYVVKSTLFFPSRGSCFSHHVRASDEPDSGTVGPWTWPNHEQVPVTC